MSTRLPPDAKPVDRVAVRVYCSVDYSVDKDNMWEVMKAVEKIESAGGKCSRFYDSSTDELVEVSCKWHDEVILWEGGERVDMSKVIQDDSYTVHGIIGRHLSNPATATAVKGSITVIGERVDRVEGRELVIDVYEGLAIRHSELAGHDSIIAAGKLALVSARGWRDQRVLIYYEPTPETVRGVLRRYQSELEEYAGLEVGRGLAKRYPQIARLIEEALLRGRRERVKR